MTHQELINIAFYVHGAVLLGSLPAWYKYGDRTEIFAKSLEGIQSTLSKMHLMISNDLLKIIKLYQSAVQSNIYGPNGEFYKEDDARFIESEAFRNFINHEPEIIAEYWVLIRAKSNWLNWALILSWMILILIILQIISLLFHGLDKISITTLPDWISKASIGATGFLVLIIFCLPTLFMQLSHGVIINKKAKYDAP